ncbi:MAG TPA: hypothetical protein VFU02_06465 [Polyangiaceae bacterium]|nr:hypothetical protein [Polyangiaceae bacterium]
MTRDTGAEMSGQRPYLKAREGLQMAFNTGLRFPMGDATAARGDTLAARYSYQLPLVFDIGSKVTPPVHVGGYAGFAWGAEGSADAVEEYCDDDDGDLSNDISCSTYAYKAGLQAQYHLAPSARYNPWLGYGAGVELVSQSLNDSTRRFEERTLSTALTLAKVDLGVDFRSRSGVGMGLYSEASVGRFVHSRTEINGDATYVGKVEDPAWHVWLGAGLRLVLFP